MNRPPTPDSETQRAATLAEIAFALLADSGGSEDSAEASWLAGHAAALSQIGRAHV